jgi:site-specific DNA recombinase
MVATTLELRPTTTACRRCVIYTRISKDDLQQGKGVQRQLEDARALATQRGWEIVGEFSDNDLSAFSGVERPAYREIMALAETGGFDCIVTYMTSRLWRNRAERATAINRLGQLRISVTAVRGPELDLSTAAGRVIADLLGSFDSLESETMSERIVRAARQRAEEGRPHAAVMFGWRREPAFDKSGRIVGSHDLENPAEANIVRQIVDRLLTGDPLRSLVRDLNASGTPAPRGGAWKPTIVRQLALRPANAGLRVYKGQVLGEGSWPPIIERDKHDRVVALLQAPERRSQRPGKRRHLLSYGLGECGVCGGPLSARTERNRRTGERHWVYRCDRGGCVSRQQGPVDELVAAVVVERLSQPDAAGIFEGNDEVAAEARERAGAIRARLNLAADQYAGGDIDGEQLKRITSRLRPELEAAEEDVKRSRPKAVPTEVDLLQGDRASAVWADLPVNARRAVLDVLQLVIVIMPRSNPGPGFDPLEIQFRWSASSHA